MGKRAKRLERMCDRLAEQAAKWQQRALEYRRDVKRLRSLLGQANYREFMASQSAEILSDHIAGMEAALSDARTWAAAWKRAAKHERSVCAALTVLANYHMDEATIRDAGIALLEAKEQAALRERDEAREWSAKWEAAASRRLNRIATLEGLLKRWLTESESKKRDQWVRGHTRAALGETGSIDADSAALARAMAETTERTPLGDMLDEAAVCSVHGRQMQHVRPGKWQCEQCDAERFGAGEGQ